MVKVCATLTDEEYESYSLVCDAMGIRPNSLARFFILTRMDQMGILPENEHQSYDLDLEEDV
jgi:hypothetical protein